MNQLELAKRLRLERVRSGLKQYVVAKALELDATAMVRIENGQRSVSALELIILIKLYEMNPIDLIAEK